MGKFSISAEKKYKGIFGCSDAGRDLKDIGLKVAGSKLGSKTCRSASYKAGTARLNKMHKIAKELQKKNPKAKYSDLLAQAAKKL